ncbi:hypothetical protein KP509_17G036100 [Ceratopteris richardii]|nr:hypothetical protein KP509_17G036100 [Ceratopteris richardii]
MQEEGLFPNAVTFCSILKACGSIRAVDKGEEVHNEIAEQGLLQHNLVLGNALVDMYVKCGSLPKAYHAFKELGIHDAVSWNTLIAGFAHQGQGYDALTCVERMQCEGLFPNAVTFICALKACANVCSISAGAQIHLKISSQGLFDSDVLLSNALMDMYVNCGALLEAERVLKSLNVQNTSSWNVLISGYIQQNKGYDALNCYKRMQIGALPPDVVTYLGALKACGNINAVDEGKHIHNEMSIKGFTKDVRVATALIDMYAKCGAFMRAWQVLEELCIWDVASWNALIAGYTRKGLHEEAIHCFDIMQKKGVLPDEVTLTCILKACGNAGAIARGEQVHQNVVQKGWFKQNQILCTGLLNMYAKCGALAKAEQLLDELPFHDVISFSALTAAYAQQGLSHKALNCIKHMQNIGLPPNAITLSSMLYACSHSGLVDEGQTYFTNLTSRFGIMADLEHCTCIVDLLGRAGYFSEAILMLQRMPSSEFLSIWSTLMGSSRKWGNIAVGRWAFDHAIQIDKNNTGAYICMASMYLAAGMHSDAKAIERMRLRNINCDPISHTV